MSAIRLLCRSDDDSIMHPKSSFGKLGGQSTEEPRPKMLLGQVIACPGPGEGMPSASGITQFALGRLTSTARHVQSVSESPAAPLSLHHGAGRQLPADNGQRTPRSPCRQPHRCARIRHPPKSPRTGNSRRRCRSQRTTRRSPGPHSPTMSASACRTDGHASPRSSRSSSCRWRRTYLGNTAKVAMCCPARAGQAIGL
jgi:hypothetical protein